MGNRTAISVALSLPALQSCSACMQAIFHVVLPLIVSCVFLAGARRGKKPMIPNGNRLPPSPWRLPVIGNLHQLGSLQHRSLRALAAAHGPVMLLRLGQMPAVLVSSADAAREVMQAQDHVFASRPWLTIPRRLLYGCTDIAFAPHGPYWRGARKMSVRHLLSPSRVSAYRVVREQEVEALVRRVGEQAGNTVHLSELPNDFAKDVAGRIVLGLRAAGDDGWRAKVDALLEESNVLLAAFHVGDFIPWLSWVSYVDGTDARVRRASERIDRILEEIVDAATATAREIPSPGQEGTNDVALIHVLLSMQQNESSVAPGTAEWCLSRDNVKALLEGLFGAGTEATIIVLEWAMAELLRNKGAMHKLQREVRQARSASSHNNMIGEQDLPGMEYLRAAAQISNRYDVPSSTMVIVNAWAIARDPEAWESPEEFRPERFVGSGVDFRGQHFQSIPFGAGRRMCPGINLAMSVVELALANLVAGFDWALPEGEVELDMEETTGCTARKRAPHRAIATRCYF
ncbi:hypothetical protein BS78_07G141600 [Paspalum vaginatum]|nr:hypothetical protein BS78_07G141600 [Paspalum vaginatum]